MTKRELLKKLSENTELSQKAVNEVLEALVRTITIETRNKGNVVRIAGLGTFYRKSAASRRGFNPLLKKKITIPAYRSVGFRVSDTLKLKV